MDCTLENENDTISLNNDLLEEEEMALNKYGGFNTIILYAYVENELALKLMSETDQNGNINIYKNIKFLNMPLELYEYEHIAGLFKANPNQKLMCFAVDVRKIYDELGIVGTLNAAQKADLERKKKASYGIRSLKAYKAINKKGQAYIAYTITNCQAIISYSPI